MKTKYIKVPVSERLPEKSGDYVIIDPNGKKGIGLFINKEFQRLVTPEYWLEEKPDYEEEMKEMLEEFTEAIEFELIIIKENTDNDGWENYGGRLYEKAKSLLTKLKTKES